MDWAYCITTVPGTHTGQPSTGKEVKNAEKFSETARTLSHIKQST